MTKHVHADLMVEYAKDAQTTDKPWFLWEFRATSTLWISCSSSPSWDVVLEYRRKRKTHIVNGKEVAAPLDKIDQKQTVWMWHPVTTHISYYVIEDVHYWNHALKRGFLFSTKEYAQENIDAHFPIRNI